MKFLINTRYSAAGTTVLEALIRRLEKGEHIVIKNDEAITERYDIALFMAPDSTVRQVKKTHPDIRCGIFDPKATLSWQRKEARAADFLVVSSIEQREFFLKYNKNIFIYYMFPDTEEVYKEHGKKEKIIIGYHGNKQHLDAMKDASWALDKVSERYNIELHAIYNIQKLGKWKRCIPKKCPVRHIQWSESAVSLLTECDIGICPSITPVGFLGKALARPLRSYLYNPEGYINQDHLLRFKPSNNPGRIYVFSQYHIPVIADFTPSSSQLISDEVSGYLVGTKEGWRRALETLIVNNEVRAKMSTSLKKSIDTHCAPSKIHEDFIQFLQSLHG